MAGIKEIFLYIENKFNSQESRIKKLEEKQTELEDWRDLVESIRVPEQHEPQPEPAYDKDGNELRYPTLVKHEDGRVGVFITKHLHLPLLTVLTEHGRCYWSQKETTFKRYCTPPKDS